MTRVINKVGWIVAGVLALLVVASLARVTLGGPLDPPAAPGSTQRTLIFQPANCAAFPITISTSGSYLLAQNITMPAACAQDGIDITVDNVTLDLNGFTLKGVVGSLKGISVPGLGTRNTAVRNGTVTRWGGDGISSNANQSQYEDLMLTLNGGDGLNLSGAKYYATVTRVVASQNSAKGFSLDRGTVLSDCTAGNNTGIGIQVSGPGSTVTNCSVVYNGGGGILVTLSGPSPGALIENNTVTNNTGIGILVAGYGGTIRGNTVTESTTNGIEVTGNGNEVDGNHVDHSVLDGIKVSSKGNSITNNSVSNGSPDPNFPIEVTGSSNNIDGNSVESAVVLNGGLGLSLNCIILSSSSKVNVMTRNRGTGFTDSVCFKDAGTGNTFGPTLLGPASLASTNPWSNIVY
jgi:parallel beta-helix repeat protein